MKPLEDPGGSVGPGAKRAEVRSLGPYFLIFFGLVAGCRSRPVEPPMVTPTARPTPQASATVRPFPRESIQSIVKNCTQKFSGRSGLVVGLALAPPEQWVQHRAEESFEAASLVKLPILVELSRRIQAGQLRAEDSMVFEERHRVGGSGVLQQRPAGGRYRLDQLAEWMVAESDNVATDMLLEHLGLEQVHRQAVALGLRHTTVERTIFDFASIDAGKDNRTCARDMAWLLAQLADRRLAGSEWMLALLEKTRRRDLLVGGLPPGCRVAHKTGQLDGFLHEAALLRQQPPILLVVLTAGSPPEEAQAFMQSLARQVYEQLREGSAR